MGSIETKALSIYQKNISFLKEGDNKLYNRIEQLSSILENGTYDGRYHLEYLEEEDEFDIFDVVTQKYLYDKKPKQFIKNALNETNFDKSSSIDLLDKKLYNHNTPTPITDDMTLKYKTLSMVANNIFEYIKVFRTSTLYKGKEFKYIDKFVFVGTLLGTHILPIDEKIKAKAYLIFEHNLELFRLSLFTTEYYKLSQNSKIIFSIMDEEVDFLNKMGDYFHTTIRSNYMVKYYCSNYNIHNYFDKIIEVSSMKNPLAFSYRRILDNFLKPALKNINNFPVINFKKDHKLFQGKPLLYIAAGPSLDKNKQWLIENKDQFNIATIGGALKTLKKLNVKPDIVITADGDEIIQKQFTEDIVDFISDCVLWLSTITNQVIIDKLPKSNIILFEAMGEFKNNSIQFNGYSVGEVGLSILANLGADEIYLLGTDLAFDQETGASHTSDHQRASNFELTEDKMEFNSFMQDGTYCMGDSTTIVKGNFRDKVITSLTMQKSIPSYNKSINIILNKNPNVKIYNMSDGAYFENTIPLEASKVYLKNPKSKLLSKDILSYFKQYSESKLTVEEQRELKKSVNKIDTLIQYINNIKDIKVRTYDQLSDQRAHIINFIKNDLSKFQRYYLDRLFIYYILTVEPYLGYQFNDTNIENEAVLVKKVKKIWIKQLLDLSEEYKEVVLRYIDEENYILTEKEKEKIRQLYTNKTSNKEELFNLLKDWYEIDQENLFILETFGGFLQQQNEYKKALHMYKNYIELSDQNSNIYLNAAKCEFQEKNYENCLSYLSNISSSDLLFNDASYLYGKIMLKKQYYLKALECFTTINIDSLNKEEVYNYIGVCFVNLNKKEDAKRYFQKSIDENSSYIEAYLNLSLLHIHHGESLEAIKLLNGSLEKDPSNIVAYKLLSDMGPKVEWSDLDIEKIKKLENGSVNLKNNMLLNYTLAKIFELKNNYDKSFQYLQKANHIQQEISQYNINTHKIFFDKLKEKFINFESDNLKQNLSDKKNMIFIVGMPRSGTSLIEQVLSSHSDVCGMGELNYLALSIENIINRVGDLNITNDTLKIINDEYFEMINQFNISEPYITDKMPQNFLYIGVILKSFPNSKIVHIKRDPIATCWSIYKNYFTSAGTGYSCSFDNIVLFYKLYLDIMKFWETQFPNQIYHLDYDKFTENQLDETKKLLQQCNLSWEDSCIEFHNNSKVVKTISTSQVREKLYKNSSQMWKNYSEYLNPLVDKLKDEKII